MAEPAVDPLLVVSQEIRTLRNEVHRLANWWDVLPQQMANGMGRPPWEDIFAEIVTYTRLQPKVYPSTHIELITRPMSDRLELTLRVDMVPVWQRAVFFAPPAPDREN